MSRPSEKDSVLPRFPSYEPSRIFHVHGNLISQGASLPFPLNHLRLLLIFLVHLPRLHSDNRPTMKITYKACHEVSSTCPVDATTYGYYPNLAVNSFFLALFSICLVIQLFVGAKTRTWTYTIALGIGTFGELVGYIGRVLMHFNPWNSMAFQMQICCLILAPSFLAAAIYLTLKHLIMYHGSEYSRLRARSYPWTFISCDFGSIALQAVGGGVAAAAGSGENITLLNAGNILIVTGIAFQVATMSVCGVLIADYFLRRKRALQKDSHFENDTKNVSRSRQPGDEMHPLVNVFIGATAFAYVTVLVRCIYRLPEMAGGWGNPRMRNEKDFLLLDGMMIALATLALTIVHPGYFFSPMRKSNNMKEAGEEMSN